MLWAVSTDGILYDGAMHVNGEVTRRYDGGSKDIGPCNYQIGVYEGGGQTPGKDMWIVYSMSKEDIWISKIPVPLLAESTGVGLENFESIKSLVELNDWNIYSPKWAPINIKKESNNTFLKLSDYDPYDYSKAFKVFKKAEQMLNIKFKVLAQQTSHGRFEIEIGNTKELDPIKISLSQNGRVSVSGWNGENDLGPYKENMWLNFELKLNIKENNFSIIYNNHLTDNLIFNSKKLNYLDRITFRTGLQRGISINPVEPKTDMPLKDNAVFFVDDVEISSN